MSKLLDLSKSKTSNTDLSILTFALLFEDYYSLHLTTAAMNLTSEGTLLKTLTSLLKEYNQEKAELMPHDFIEKKMMLQPLKITKTIAAKFILMMKHEELIKTMVNSFWNSQKLKPINKEYTAVLMFFIIFELGIEYDADDIEAFKKSNYQYCLSVLEYFMAEENLIEITQEACKIYENNYVLEKILTPLNRKMPLIKHVCQKLSKEINSVIKIASKPPTLPQPPSFLTRVKKAPPAPVSTPILEQKLFKSKPFKMPDAIVDRPAKKVTPEKEELEVKPFALSKTNIPPKEQETEKVGAVKSQVSKFKAKPPPPKQNIIIKTTTSTVMREAAVLSKQQEKELNVLQRVLSGAPDPFKIVELENRIRYDNEQKSIRAIERKHLMGMLSYEESLLAKRKLLENNKQKMLMFKKERDEIIDEINKWREQEEIKMKNLVEKGQNIAKAAKESMQKLQLERQEQVKLTSYEKKKLLDEAMKAREEELDRKAKLIKELRMLHEIHKMQTQNKEFDRTECPNFGFLCEMSIAELQERLGLLKMEMQMELQERQEAIVKNRERRQKFVQETQDFVKQIRLCKKSGPEFSFKKPESEPELDALRERLEVVRNLRMTTAQS